MNTEVLEDIGLSQIEIKVFITLLELGEAKAGEVIKKTGLQSSSVHYAINSLIEKGFVSYIKKSQVKFYRAADPGAILNYIDLKKKEYLKILLELKERQKKGIEEGVEFYKSFKGIKTIISELLKDVKKGDLFRTFSVEDPEEYEKARERVFAPVKQLVKQKKIIMKGIFHEKNREKKKKSSIMQKRYLDFSMPPNTMIINNKVAIVSWKDEPVGTLIKSEDIAKSYIDFFDGMWKQAKR